METRKVRIGFSLGLAVLALLHAVALVGLMVVVDYHDTFEPIRSAESRSVDNWSIDKVAAPRTGMNSVKVEPYRENANKVNYDAQHELKHGDLKEGCSGVGCSINSVSRSATVLRNTTVFRNPVVYTPATYGSTRFVNAQSNRPLSPGDRDVDGAVVVSVNQIRPAVPAMQPNVVYDNSPPPLANSNPPARPKPNQPVAPRPTPRDPDLVIPLDSTLPKLKPFEIAVFVGEDQRSRAVESWFESHPGLSELKEDAEFNVFRAGDPLFQARYSGSVNPKDFPVVIVQDNQGGHVHAAGGAQFPRNADQLLSDIRKGKKYHGQIKNQFGTVESGLIKTNSYSWDEQVAPYIYRSTDEDDVISSEITIKPNRLIHPIDRLLDRRNQAEALVWVNATEIATVFLLCVAGVLVILIIRKYK